MTIQLWDEARGICICELCGFEYSDDIPTCPKMHSQLNPCKATIFKRVLKPCRGGGEIIEQAEEIPCDKLALEGQEFCYEHGKIKEVV